MAPRQPYASSFSLSSLLPIESPAFTARSSLYLSPSRRVFLEHSKNHDGTRCRFLPSLRASHTAASSSAYSSTSLLRRLSRSPALFTRTLTRERAWKGARVRRGSRAGSRRACTCPARASRNREKGILTKRVLCNFDEMTHFYLRKV